MGSLGCRLCTPHIPPSPTRPSLASAIAPYLSVMLSPYFRTFLEREKTSFEGEKIEFYGQF